MRYDGEEVPEERKKRDVIYGVFTVTNPSEENIIQFAELEYQIGAFHKSEIADFREEGKK